MVFSPGEAAEMHYGRNLPIRVIAGHLGVSKSYVYAQLQRAWKEGLVTFDVAKFPPPLRDNSWESIVTSAIPHLSKKHVWAVDAQTDNAEYLPLGAALLYLFRGEYALREDDHIWVGPGPNIFWAAKHCRGTVDINFTGMLVPLHGDPSVHPTVSPDDPLVITTWFTQAFRQPPRQVVANTPLITDKSDPIRGTIFDTASFPFIRRGSGSVAIVEIEPWENSWLFRTPQPQRIETAKAALLVYTRSYDLKIGHIGNRLFLLNAPKLERNSPLRVSILELMGEINSQLAGIDFAALSNFQIRIGIVSDPAILRAVLNNDFLLPLNEERNRKPLINGLITCNDPSVLAAFLN